MVMRLAEPVSRNLPALLSSSTVFLIASSKGSVAEFWERRAISKIASELGGQLCELLKWTESGRELTFADHVRHFDSAQGS